MSYPTVFECIDKILDRRHKTFHGRSKFYWELPRQCGVTNYLVNKAIDRVIAEDAHILYITANDKLIKYIQENFGFRQKPAQTKVDWNITFKSIGDILNKSHQFKGNRKYTYIFIDTINYNLSLRDSWELGAILAPLTPRYILHLETTEG